MSTAFEKEDTAGQFHERAMQDLMAEHDKAEQELFADIRRIVQEAFGG